MRHPPPEKSEPQGQRDASQLHAETTDTTQAPQGDSVAYQGQVIPATSPKRLQTLAQLAGLEGPKLTNAHVLDVGCGDGANLLALAFYNPRWTLVGFDPSEAAIAKAQAAQESLGLDNLRFEHAKASTYRNTQAFDIVLCHGVYSWTHADEQTAIMHLARDLLSPDGLFYLSYNCEPGWRMRGLVRERLRRSVARKERAPSLATAKADLQALKALLSDDNAHPFAQLLRRELGFADSQARFHLAHEYLADNNQAFWFGDVLQRATACGFRYVGDAMQYRREGFIPEAQRQGAKERFADLEEYEESLDLIRYRQLRASVFSHHAAAKSEQTQLQTLRNASYFSALQPKSTRFQLAEGYREPFVCPVSQRPVDVDTKLGKSALLVLAQHYPQGLRFKSLLLAAEELLAAQGIDTSTTAEDIEDLLGGFLELFEHAMVEVSTQPFSDVAAPTSKLPAIHELARHEALNRRQLSSAFHELVALDSTEQRLLLCLDGQQKRQRILQQGTKVENTTVDATEKLERVIQIVQRFGLQRS